VRLPKLSKLEHQIMEALWSRGASSVREILEAFPEKGRPAYTTVQTMVYRLEEKGAIRRTRKIGNAHIFEAVLSRASAQRRLIDELLAFFGGSSQPVVAHLIESGKYDARRRQRGGAAPAQVEKWKKWKKWKSKFQVGRTSCWK
jgi:predicted transcriptional regulator